MSWLPLHHMHLIHEFGFQQITRHIDRPTETQSERDANNGSNVKIHAMAWPCWFIIFRTVFPQHNKKRREERMKLTVIILMHN